MANRAGFGDSPASRGIDLTQGYRDANPYFDKGFVQRQLEPYKDAGLTQNLADLRGQKDQALYDMAAKAVIKLAGVNKTPPPATPPPPGTPPPATPPPATKPPKSGKPPKPPVIKVPKPPVVSPQPAPVPGKVTKKNKRKHKVPSPGGVSPRPRAPHEGDPFPNG